MKLILKLIKCKSDKIVLFIFVKEIVKKKKKTRNIFYSADEILIVRNIFIEHSGVALEETFP